MENSQVSLFIPFVDNEAAFDGWEYSNLLFNYTFYLFNVTNPEQVTRDSPRMMKFKILLGARPKLKQIGPYCYTKNVTHISTFKEENQLVEAFTCDRFEQVMRDG